MLPGGIASCYPVGLVILGIGTVLDVVGVATPEWTVVSGFYHYGLWKECIHSDCVDISESSKTDAFKVCEAFAILGLIASGAAFVSSLLFLILPMLKRSPHKILNVMALIFAIAGALLTVVCLSTWRAKVKEDLPNVDLGYSFFLSVAGTCLMAIGGLFVFFQGRRVGSYSLIGE